MLDTEELRRPAAEQRARGDCRRGRVAAQQDAGDFPVRQRAQREGVGRERAGSQAAGLPGRCRHGNRSGERAGAARSLLLRRRGHPHNRAVGVRERVRAQVQRAGGRIEKRGGHGRLPEPAHAARPLEAAHARAEPVDVGEGVRRVPQLGQVYITERCPQSHDPIDRRRLPERAVAQPCRPGDDVSTADCRMQFVLQHRGFRYVPPTNAKSLRTGSVCSAGNGARVRRRRPLDSL